MTNRPEERRTYLRIETPLQLKVVGKENVIYDAITKDISPLGLRFETKKKDVDINDEVALTITIPEALSPVHASARVVWKRRLLTEEGAPFDIGCRFIKIEEDNKNTFLKYFCDLRYKIKKH